MELSLEEVKKTQLEILKVFASFCESNGITYYLAYGTLIGAIRHKGYIPWDDDIDVIMPRPDYNRFIREFKDNRYVLFCPESNVDCPFSYGKLYDSHTIIEEQTSCHYRIGLNIDIFILDGMPNNLQAAKKHIRNCKYWIRLLEIKRIAFDKNRAYSKNLLLLFFKVLASPFPIWWARNNLIKLNQKFDFSTSHYCSDLCYTDALFLSKDVFGKGLKALFEGREYVIPSNSNYWLSAVYGDYMQLPPLEKRVTHHAYKAFTLE